MSTFTVQVDQEDQEHIRRAFSLLERAGQDLKPVMADLGAVLVQGVDERFQKEVDPDGHPWAKLADSTIEQKRLKGRILKILQSTGILRGTINYKVDGTTLAVGSPMEYAEHHQFGKPGPWIIRPKDKKALFWPGAPHPFGSVTHPGLKARPFLGISANDRSGIDRALKSWIKRILDGA